MHSWSDAQVAQLIRFAIESFQSSYDAQTSHTLASFQNALETLEGSLEWHLHRGQVALDEDAPIFQWHLTAASHAENWEGFQPHAFHVEAFASAVQRLRNGESHVLDFSTRSLGDGCHAERETPSSAIALLSMTAEGNCNFIELVSLDEEEDSLVQDTVSFKVLSDHLSSLNLTNKRPAAPKKASHKAKLTPRQSEVLELLVEGMSAKQIAVRLQLSYHTVNEYIRAIYQRYRVSSRAELLSVVHKGYDPAPLFNTVV